MRDPSPKEPTFDLGDFRRRAARVQRRMKRSYATLSKRLFTSARTLPELMDRSEPDETRSFPALHRLLLADRRLRALEQQLAAQPPKKPPAKSPARNPNRSPNRRKVSP
jgi:hypothetical protein